MWWIIIPFGLGIIIIVWGVISYYKQKNSIDYMDYSNHEKGDIKNQQVKTGQQEKPRLRSPMSVLTGGLLKFFLYIVALYSLFV